jgi:chaperonin cofactor prefoldin
MATPTQHHSVQEITAHLRALHSQMQQQQTHNAPISQAQLKELMSMIEELEALPPPEPPPED